MVDVDVGAGVDVDVDAGADVGNANDAVIRYREGVCYLLKNLVLILQKLTLMLLFPLDPAAVVLILSCPLQ